MFKSINYIIKADKKIHILSLPVMLFAQLDELSKLYNLGQSKFYNVKLVNTTYERSKNNYRFEYSLGLRNNKIYELKTRQGILNTQETIKGNCKISDQLKSFTEIIGGHLVCQKYTLPNRRHSSKAISSLLKLDRSTLGKCRYTSLKLAVRSPAFLVASVANFCTDNLAKVKSRNQNQEQYL